MHAKSLSSARRAYIFWVLGRTGKEEEINRLLTQESNPSVRLVAFYSLASINSKSAADDVSRLLENASEKEYIIVLKRILSSKNTSFQSLTARAAKNKNLSQEVRTIAITTLAGLGLPESLSIFRAVQC